MMFKSLTTITKVLIGTTAALAAATTVSAMKDHKAAKAECPCECECTECEVEDTEKPEE